MKYLTFYERLILEGIDLSGADGYNDNNNDRHYRVTSAYNIFLSEMNFAVEREGIKKAFESWLSGLCSAIYVPFDNYEILQLAEKDGFNLSTELAEDNFLNMYFANLTSAFFTLKENL